MQVANVAGSDVALFLYSPMNFQVLVGRIACLVNRKYCLLGLFCCDSCLQITSFLVS